MNRQVLICRHAETYDPFPFQPDFERELTPEGLRQASRTGQWLRENFQKVDAILASPARRTSATSKALAAKLYFDADKIFYDPDLYNAKESQLLTSLSNLADNVKIVLVVAHNPGITRLIRTLSDTPQMPYLEPSAVAALNLELTSWEDIFISTGELIKHNFEHQF
jgi:phosphohistidine phosphatase